MVNLGNNRTCWKFTRFLDEAAAIYKQNELSTAERVRVAKIQAEILRVILNCAKFLKKSANELVAEEIEINDYIDEISELMNGLMDEIEAIVLFAQIENMTPLFPQKVMTYQTAEC